ncbi:MAG: FG-GAP-like repeat-containing protein [Micrococcales bacterium]|nr:FG-GAP-like repeat-containing protein [Micrococcales bacterium]
MMTHVKARFALSALAVAALATAGLAHLAAAPSRAADVVTPMVSTSDSHTLALKSDGTVWAWGYNGFGQLGDGSTTDRLTPVQVKGGGGLGNLSGVKAVFAKGWTSYALKIDGTVWTWGYNSRGQLGDGSLVARSYPVQVRDSTSNLTGVTTLETSLYNAYAIKADGTLWAWGQNNLGQLGVGDTNDRSLATRVGSLANVTAVAQDVSSAYALRTNGPNVEIWSWGDNSNGQLGRGTVANPTIPGQVTLGLSKEVWSTSGRAHVLLTDGAIRAWGRNDYGQLGDGTTTDRNSPQVVGGLSFSGVVDIKQAFISTYTLKTDGTVWAWGANGAGQLGDGTTIDRPSPVQVASLTNIAAIYASPNGNPYALGSDGKLWAWGNNYKGQVGNGTTDNQPLPVQIGSLTGITQLYTGYRQLVAQKPDGTLWAWGDNYRGQLGDGSTTDRHSPVIVKGAGGVGFFNLFGPDFQELVPTVSISGTAKVGSSLTAKVAGKLPTGWKATYQWLRNGVAISGAKAATYKIVAADAGTKLSVKVTVSAVSGMPSSAVVTSKLVAVAALPKPSPSPSKTPTPSPSKPSVPTPSPGAATGMAQVILSPSLSGSQYGDVLAVDQAGTLWRYPSSASGALGARLNLGTGWSGLTVYAPGDWNNDGKNDVIAVDQASGKMFLFAGNGQGGLAAKVQIGQGWGGYRVIPAGDLNGDSFVDLLVIKQATGELFLYAGDGKGGFKYPYPKVGYGWIGYDLYAASDINKDGLADILSIDSKGDLWFYAGKGDGTFKKKIQVGNGWGGYQLSAGADLNGDGMADIVSVDSKGTLFFYAAKGGGLFAKKIQLATGW